MPVDFETDVVSEISRLGISIDREAAAVATTLNDDRATSDDYPRIRELRRQLGALQQLVARATTRSQDQPSLRVELATLLSFAKTLRTDAEAWQTAVEDRLTELERQETAAREQRERLTAEREALRRRRDALQVMIDETARRIAQQHGGDCRRTVPVFRLDEALTVCSVAVLSPRKGFRPQKYSLVTLNVARDEVQVTRS